MIQGRRITPAALVFERSEHICSYRCLFVTRSFRGKMSMMMNCAFCGSKPVQGIHYESGKKPRNFIRCSNDCCGAEIIAGDFETVLRRWNLRIVTESSEYINDRLDACSFAISVHSDRISDVLSRLDKIEAGMQTKKTCSQAINICGKCSNFANCPSPTYYSQPSCKQFSRRM